ncbi:hypothetical protein H2684_02965 [Clostridium sp. cel8]|jgi:ABC-2 type transport system permease protein|uniref:hypothetical protein n=1 Tax=Clostridium sp. cel8 TaxID=2663123 RepID=UPI0015F59966|nr:hypothetical protein [Clostridium sp. cel8]MBA5850277.1 hypothetical protein [Clostridium sp. cel8]
MLKLVKYELKGYYKDFLIMTCAIILLNLFLCFKINDWTNESIMIANMMISFAAYVIVFVWNIKVFSRDIYEDSGYLMFTLPKRGYEILGSKIITCFIQFIMVFAVSSIITVLWAELLNVTSGLVLQVRNTIDFISKYSSVKFMIFGLLSVIVIYTSYLLTGYLAITLSKVAIKNKKFGKIGSFIIFIILVIAQGKIDKVFQDIFPQTFNINVVSSGVNSVFINSNANLHINISSAVLSVTILIIMFYAVAYLLENKLDL